MNVILFYELQYLRSQLKHFTPTAALAIYIPTPNKRNPSFNEAVHSPLTLGLHLLVLYTRQYRGVRYCGIV